VFRVDPAIVWRVKRGNVGAVNEDIRAKELEAITRDLRCRQLCENRKTMKEQLRKFRRTKKWENDPEYGTN